MLTTKQMLLGGLGATTIIGGSTAGIYFSTRNKTIEDSLISDGIELIKSDDQYQVAFKELKNDGTFISDLKSLTNTVTDSVSLTDGGNALKKWCEEKLKISLSDNKSGELSTKARKYCIALPTTAKEKLVKNNYTPVTDWGAKFDLIKTDTGGSIRTDLTKIKDTITDLSNSDQRSIILETLQKWCNQNENTKLNTTDADTIYPKVETRCFNKITG